MARVCKAPSVSPLLLRLALGAMFLTAGIGKLAEQEITGPMAGTLEAMNIGRVITPSASSPGAVEIPSPGDTPPSSDTPASGGEEAASSPDIAKPDNAAPTGDADADQAPDTAAVNTDAGEGPTVKARRVEMLTASLRDASQTTDERGRLIPAALGARQWARTLAWTAMLTEIIAGGLMVVGLFTRLGALGLMFVMGVAMWLTQIGPVVMSRTPGAGFLGFLPAPGFAGDGWQHLLLQFVLFMVAFAVLLMGAGRISLDAWVFGRDDTPPSGDARRRRTIVVEEGASRPRRPDHPGEIALD